MSTFSYTGLLSTVSSNKSNNATEFNLEGHNSLLGNTSSSATENKNVPVDALDNEIRTSKFVATGLLDSTPSITTSNSEPASRSLIFQSTGLLKANILSETLQKSSMMPVHKAEATPSFTSNSLLSELADTSLPSTHTSMHEHRQSYDTSHEPSTSSRPSTISIARPSIKATTYDGKTVYVRRKPKFISTSRSDSSSTQRIGNLLDVPIHRLMDQLSVTTATSLQRADIISPTPISTSANASSTPADDMLWVDRYRPQKFTDLLGNERVARDAMTWIKQWDWCVFGKKKGIKRNRDEEENIDPDEYRRPRQKILLLSGPPGLGKTTLAHVLARQVGYEVMEINASDARTGSIVDDRIRPALESGSAIGSTKPILLVIDEIDGATGAGDNANTFVHKLVQLIQVKPKFKNQSFRGKDKNARRPILRPIICICNDHNASSLVKLRPHTYQIRFNRPADIHLVKRLKEICLVEELKADSRALNTLVSVARGDLRGCLNTLQFVKTRKEDVTETVIRKATAGMKEEDTTVQSVLHDLFTPMTKKRAKELGLTDEEEARYVGRLTHAIDATSRESVIASGCFGHYATLRRHDANFSRQEKAMDWLTTFDQFSSAMYTDGEFALNQYLPYTLVPFYPLFQERGAERVERNQADWEHLLLTRSNEEILKSFSRCLRNATIRYGGDFRHLVTHPVLQTEFAPYINRIISPPLRPVNSQVVRPLEKALMSRLVDIMSTLELRFVQEKADDGQLTYRLDPPIDVFITYDGKRAPDITVSRYAVRQIVSGEIDARLIARDTEFIEKGKRGKQSFFGKARTEENTTEDSSNPNKSPNKRAKTIDDRDIADRPPTDFFGRLITVPSASTTKAAARKNIEKKYRVQYRFLEGNSAAVRKPVKVSTFL